MARVSAIDYQETVWSHVFPGNQLTVNCLPDALQGVQSSLELAAKQRKRTVWRMDGGGGSEANFRLLLQQGYQLHAKGLSSSRAAALAKTVSRWDPYGDIWLGDHQVLSRPRSLSRDQHELVGILSLSDMEPAIHLEVPRFVNVVRPEELSYQVYQA